MAITLTNQRLGAREIVVDVISSADADVAAVIPHGLDAAPLQITLTPLLANFYLSEPTVGVVDGVNINLVLVNAVGSGNPAAQIRVVARLNADVKR